MDGFVREGIGCGEKEESGRVESKESLVNPCPIKKP